MKEIQCKRCFFFTPEWCPKKHDSLDPDLIRDCQYFRTKTNADRIRAMTDEELAVWLDDMICDCDCNPVPCREFCKVEDCHEAWLRWLKKEVEE